MRRSLLLALLLLTLFPWPGRSAAQAPKNPKWKNQEYEKNLAALDDKDSIERARAIEGLKRLGDVRAVEPLLEHGVGERYPYVVSLAGETAARLDPDAALVKLEKLVDERGDADARTRRNLVVLLAEMEQKEAGELLLEKFGGSRSKEVFLEVLRAVGDRRLPGGVGIVKRALAARDVDVENAGAIAAGLLGDEDFVPILLGALENSDGEHCKFAAWALNQIDDPTIFSQVQARLGSASGVTGEAKAKVLERSARKDDAERLIAILAGSTSREYREAAAIALGRLGIQDKRAQEVLFSRMLRDGQREVRGACWHALSRVATKDIAGPLVMKHLRQRETEQAKYVFHLAGDLGLSKAAAGLLKVMVTEKKDFILRQSASINFWKVADAKTVEKFEDRLQEQQWLELGIEALGFRRNPEGFRFALKMLQVLRDGSKEEFAVEKALERMTGHFFGPYPGLWKKWFEKHPEFFTPKQSELERNKWRDEFDKEDKGFRQTEETEYAVQLGLEFLARHQHPDGRFDPQRFYEVCPDTPPCKREGSRFQLDPVGTTALGVLAFLGGGYTPTQGKYKRTIRKALEYLMARQQANGNFLSNDLVGGYNRPIGAQAFTEAFMITGDDQYRWYAQVGIDFLTTIQNTLGGWRYRVNIETTDTSCMSWNLFAVKAGEKAGLDTKEIAVAGCYHVMDMYSQGVPPSGPREDFIDIDPAYGFEVGRDTDYTFETGYQNPVWDTKYATVPLGIMCRIFMGWRRSHPFCIGSANKVLQDLMEEIPKNEDWSKYTSKREYPTYAWYYGTLAMHQMGGRYFRKWNETIKKVIPGTQEREGCIRGSWPLWNHDVFGRVYTAAMGVLALETYYRYLPVLQD